jgi:hypothetical protein
MSDRLTGDVPAAVARGLEGVDLGRASWTSSVTSLAGSGTLRPPAHLHGADQLLADTPPFGPVGDAVPPRARCSRVRWALVAVSRHGPGDRYGHT